MTTSTGRVGPRLYWGWTEAQDGPQRGRLFFACSQSLPVKCVTPLVDPEFSPIPAYPPVMLGSSGGAVYVPCVGSGRNLGMTGGLADTSAFSSLGINGA